MSTKSLVAVAAVAAYLLRRRVYLLLKRLPGGAQVSRAPRRARPSCRARGPRSRRSCPTAVGVGLKGRGCRTSVAGRRGQRGRICLASVVGRRGPTSVVGQRGRICQALVVGRRGPTLAVGRVRRGRICQALAVARDPRGRTLAVDPGDRKGLTLAAGQGSTGRRCVGQATFDTHSPWADLPRGHASMCLARLGFRGIFAPISG